MTEGAAFVGSVLGDRFRVESVIGPGERGAVVLRGYETATGAPVAIRCPGIPPELVGNDYRGAIDTFLREAEALARASAASHDVEQLLGFGIAESGGGRTRDLPYCAFEWLEGKSLEQHLVERAGRAQSLGEAIAILEPAARALAAAHAVGITHRDVRPRNLWLANVDGARMRMKLTQFVLASRVGSSDDAFSPRYAAPEHFKRTYGAVGPSTDVYGLALCLVELVSGRQAFEGSDPAELYLATSDLGRRPTLRTLGVQASDAVEVVLARALAVDPKRRWQSARELWDALLDAIPELTPAAPSLRPREGGSGAIDLVPSEPPRPKLSLHPAEDLRLGESTSRPITRPPSKMPEAPAGDRSGRAAWLLVLVVGALATVVVALSLARAARARSQAHARAVAAAAGAPADAGPPPPLAPAAVADMVLVAPGAFAMGPPGDPAEGPRHAVRLTRRFWIDRTEVPTSMYYACIEAGACTPNRIHVGDVVEASGGACNTPPAQARHPINCVDRAQAAACCAWAGKRLPTEAEWEYAARGADGRAYPWGNNAPTSCTMAAIGGLSGDCRERKGTSEVARTPDGRSAIGLYDMAGNVWEWVADGHAPYAAADAVDPLAPDPPNGAGVLRGGGWDYSADAAKSTFRNPSAANAATPSTGFRCARTAN